MRDANLRQVVGGTTRAARRERGLTARGWVVLSVIFVVWNALTDDWTAAGVFIALAAMWSWFAVRDERTYRRSQLFAAALNEEARRRADPRRCVVTPRERLAAIEARCEAATDAPWHAENRGVGWEVHYGPAPQDCWDPTLRMSDHRCRDLSSNSEIHEIKGTMEERDATFIAAARDDLPALAAFARAVLDAPYFARLDRITVHTLADKYLGGES